jgi:hypothetical protein
MIAGETPCSARAVAPPALIDWPATSQLKKRRKRSMKKELRDCPGLCEPKGGGYWMDGVSRANVPWKVVKGLLIELTSRDDDVISFKKVIGFMTWKGELVEVILELDCVVSHDFLPVLERRVVWEGHFT